MLKQIHHVAFIVKDLDATISSYERLLGMPVSERGFVPGRGGEVAYFKLDNVNLEFVSPTEKNGFLQQHLDAHGEGFFHMAFGVDDLDEATQELENKDITMSGPARVVFRDWRIAYIENDDTAGIRTHLIAKDAD